MKKRSILFLSLIITVLILIAGCTSTTPTTGIIEVNSTPAGAKIYFDGVDTGMATPFTFTNKEAGTYVIKLDVFHYEIWEETVTVIANETTYLNPLLTFASTQYITLQPGPTEGKDALVSNLFTESNYGSSEIIDAGTFASGTTVRSYIQFDLSSVSENARVIDADLRLYQYGTPGTENCIIDLHKVTSGWQEGTVDWSSQPNYSTETEYSTNITAGAATWKLWDIDTLVQAWLDGTVTNYGMALLVTDETTLDTIVYFHSSDYTTDTTKRPKLEIDYYIP
ncbi:MAG: DNRLRE domain-containing protein [Atribacterota bacterium]